MFLRLKIFSCRVSTQNKRIRDSFGQGQITVQGWVDALARNNGKCVSCGTDEFICIDHIVPVSLGGTNTDDNIQPLCRTCNSEKGNRIS
jgi:5-methylcytosine-specific restriction endonuclease McrA